MATITEIKNAPLADAESGSWYTILGAGGDLQEWVDGLGGMLAEQGIGRPERWFSTTGREVNAYLGVRRGSDNALPKDLVVLMFPLDGLDVGRLAMFRLVAQDRWFDDFCDNTRRLEHGEEDD